MGVQVMGTTGREMPGIDAAMQKFIANNKETADQLNNLADGARGVMIKTPQGERPLRETDPRPAYKHQDFPKAMYSKHESILVRNEEELAEALDNGYRHEPYPVVKVAVADPGIEKANLQRELKEKDGQITTLASELREMREQMKEMKAMLMEDKPRRGRPPKDAAAA